MTEQIPLSSEASALAPALDAARNDRTHEVLPDVAYRRLGIVNVVFFGPNRAGDRGWVLIDAGLPGTKGMIRSAAAERFGSDARPAAIIMTHGHFDHVGALEDLAREWDAPVYAHPLELPYLSGRASYPPGDPSVGGGLMAALARLYPRGPVDVGRHLQQLPEDGTVPGMPGWRWIHTPGHSVGHVSLWRDRDRSLIVGDAFVTTAQESAYAVAVQRPEMHGPPMYYTVEWDKAGASVTRLADLEPEVVITGHGVPMRGPEMRAALHRLASEFNTVAVPENGRYLETPARSRGRQRIPRARHLNPSLREECLHGVGPRAAPAIPVQAGSADRTAERSHRMPPGEDEGMDAPAGQSFPTPAGILFGLGLGGFFDGIVLHQILQWHHMLTDAGYPATSVENLEINTLWDGLFHATTYVFVVLGLIVLWRTSRRTHIRWSSKLLVGTLLMGFGIFNLVEGIVDHHLLGIHHVNETVPRAQWIYWDLAFLAWGAAMLIGGWFLLRAGRRETRNRAPCRPPGLSGSASPERHGHSNTRQPS